MMHEAYVIKQLLKLPLNIESLESFSDILLVGTKQGHLLMYRVFGDAQVHLLRSNKYFSKRPILLLSAVSDFNILVALTDNVVTVHDIDLAVTNFPVIATVSETRGAHLFALDVNRTKSLTGETAVTVRMVVAVRRKLQFYYWKNRRFHSLRPDMTLSDQPKALAWCEEVILVGYGRGEYSLIRLDGDQIFLPFNTPHEPRIMTLKDKRFVLGKSDHTSMIVDLEGNSEYNDVTWSSTPIDIDHDPPFLIAVTPKTIEVVSHEPNLSLQSFEISKPKFVSRGKRGMVYIASESVIWLLEMIPVTSQIPHLLIEKQFELAIVLSDILEESNEIKSKRIQDIQTLYAFNLFCNGKFKESLDIFYKLDIDPSHVIGLFGDLLPPTLRTSLTYPEELPEFAGEDAEFGRICLVEYLTKVRHKLNGISGKRPLSPIPLMDGNSLIKTKKLLMMVIDTTLLKCYLSTNDALVAPLLRLRENHCHLEETERALKRAKKVSELVIFYNTRGLHQKALELLTSDDDENVDRVVEYLQNLGPEHIDLILKFAEWVFERGSIDDGLSIFIEDVSEVESLPRMKVVEWMLRFKLSSEKNLVLIRYLEHIISVWYETEPFFHNSLILQYKDQILESDDEEEKDKVKQRLLEFLTTSSYYTSDGILPQFPGNILHEERAILLGSSGHHQEALVIYLYVLKDLQKALKYCKRFEDSSSSSSAVYSSLLLLLLKPPQHLLTDVIGPIVEYDVTDSISVLRDHGPKMELSTILRSLPNEVSLSTLKQNLKSGVSSRMSNKRRSQIYRNLLHSEHLQIQRKRIERESVKIEISEIDICPVCHKKFNSRSAFVRFPGIPFVVHYSCQERAKILSPNS